MKHGFCPSFYTLMTICYIRFARQLGHRKIANTGFPRAPRMGIARGESKGGGGQFDLPQTKAPFFSHLRCGVSIFCANGCRHLAPKTSPPLFSKKLALKKCPPTLLFPSLDKIFFGGDLVSRESCAMNANLLLWRPKILTSTLVCWFERKNLEFCRFGVYDVFVRSLAWMPQPLKIRLQMTMA